MKKLKVLVFLWIVGITLVGSNAKAANTIEDSDQQIVNQVTCVTGMMELKNRGEDINGYVSQFRKNFSPTYQNFSEVITKKVKTCPQTLTIADCAKAVNLNKQETLYYQSMMYGIFNNKKLDLGKLKFNTGLMCAGEIKK